MMLINFNMEFGVTSSSKIAFISSNKYTLKFKSLFFLFHGVFNLISHPFSKFLVVVVFCETKLRTRNNANREYT